MLKKTHAISFPRCGQHLLADMLTHYFGGNRFRYCEFYSDPELRMGVCPETNYQKNHDFDLNWPTSPEYTYIVQVRDPFEALTSLYYLEGAGKNPEEWFAEKWAYYYGFVQKWILGSVPNRLVVHYRDLVDHPVGMLSKVIHHISDEVADGSRVHKTVATVGPRGYEGTRRDCIFSPKDIFGV